MHILIAILLFPALLFGATPQEEPEKVSPEEIQAELDEAEAEFNHALELFNPWYSGPLITPSATMVPPGDMMMQPYIYFTDNYAAFDNDRKSVDVPNRFLINTQPVIVQFGVTPSVDTTVIMGTSAGWQQGQFSGGFQDINLQIGFKIQEETIHVPKAKFSISQSFPTGKYQNLDPKNFGIDGTGAGAWQTKFSLAFGKLIFWNTLHPLNTRVSLGYVVSTPIEVHNFNSYGGGYGTRGNVHPGNTFNVDLGLELSINQPWVAALDIVYNCSSPTTFSGSTLAPVGSAYSDQLSLAPAIEYNFNANMGILWGAWFTVYGRNAANFVSGIFTWYWEFGL
jgi:hypothetical protein